MRTILTLIFAVLGSASIADSHPPGEDGLRKLDATVQRSCMCAGKQASGVQAALTCTQDLNTFAGIKLEYHQTWTPVQQRLARQIEHIVETCLSEALDYRQALSKLGIEAPFTPPQPLTAKQTAPYYWKQVPPRQLPKYPSRLVLIESVQGSAVKGLLESLDDHGLRLRRARVDGGGILSYKLNDIDGAWVLLPSASNSF